MIAQRDFAIFNIGGQHLPEWQKNTVFILLGFSPELGGQHAPDYPTGIGSGEDIKNTDEIAVKVKNAVSHLLKFPIAFDPKTKVQVQTSIFSVLEIDEDFDEITLKDHRHGLPVIVEFPESERSYYQDKNLKENEVVVATLFSLIDQNGLTAEWRLLDIDRLWK